MSELGSRKLDATSLNENESSIVKRIKSDDSDSSVADTSSESQEEGDRLLRMTQAIRTIIDVSLR